MFIWRSRKREVQLRGNLLISSLEPSMSIHGARKSTYDMHSGSGHESRHNEHLASDNGAREPCDTTGTQDQLIILLPIGAATSITAYN